MSLLKVYLTLSLVLCCVLIYVQIVQRSRILSIKPQNKNTQGITLAKQKKPKKLSVVCISTLSKMVIFNSFHQK